MATKTWDSAKGWNSARTSNSRKDRDSGKTRESGKTWDAAAERFVDDDLGTDDLGMDERLRRLKRLSIFARLMDTAIRIPGTGIRFGADSVVGLLPVVGDAGSALVGLYMVYEARRLGLPPAKLVQMVGNIVADGLLGSVPVAGDLFDVFFKSNRRNLDLVLDHFGMTHEDVWRRR